MDHIHKANSKTNFTRKIRV